MAGPIQTLRDILMADPAVVTLVVDRITPLVRTQDIGVPAVTLQLITGAPENHLQGDSGLQYNRVQLDAWAETYDGAEILAKLCRTAIVAGGFICDRELDNFDDTAQLSGLFSKTQEYSVWI
jgi:hypothetical protein